MQEYFPVLAIHTAAFTQGFEIHGLIGYWHFEPVKRLEQAHLNWLRVGE